MICEIYLLYQTTDLFQVEGDEITTTMKIRSHLLGKSGFGVRRLLPGMEESTHGTLVHI